VRKIDLSNFQVATSETARDINRRILLSLIRKHQPVSRADLSRHSGLQRSTVSAITEELIADRWLTEGAVHNLPRGRKPTFLHLNAARSGIFGINLRPFTTNLALADLNGRFLAQQTMPTPASPDEFVEQISHRIRELKKLHPEMTYEGVGVSLPGRIDLFTQRFVFAPNLGWRRDDLKQQLETATGLVVELENEANACALSEFWFGGHPEGTRNIIAVAISEGIGVGMILNGQLVRGPSGLAGEFGHVTIRDGGPQCACGNQGCWEVFGSNSAALRIYREKSARSPRKVSASRQVPPPDEFEKLLALVERGDPLATETIEEVACHLGAGLSMLVTGLAPDLIVVVGEITRLWPRVGPIINREIQRQSFTHAATRVIASGPAILPRLRGIIAIVLQKRFGAPTTI
jgi:predicted NBD/HSP70 family sugar kinase